MKIKLVTGASTYEAAENTIRQIDVTKTDEFNLLVVPDTFSMQAEKLLFDCLNLTSVFNVEVVGISKLAGHILSNNNIAFQRVSGLEEIFIVYKAVKASEAEFQYFGKCDVDFCTKILQIIKQFKGCKIRPEQIKPTGDSVLDRKMHDVKLVYQTYDKLLGEKLDLSRLLEFCSENADKAFDLSKINLYFANFDSFSLEINSFICKLAKLVGKVCIGMARPISQSNAFIFEDDILRKTTALAKENSLTVETENFETKLDARRLKMCKNLFGFVVDEGKDEDYFLNVLAKNKQDELDFVAKYIKNAVFSGAKFSDFAVAISDEKYYEKISSTFEKYGIVFYSDDAVDLSNTVLCRFLLKLLQFAKLGFNKERLQYLAGCCLLSVSDKEAVLKAIEFFNVEDKDEFLQRFPEYEKIITQVELLAKAESITEFAAVLKAVISLCEGEHQKLLSSLAEQGLFKEESQNAQAKELIFGVLDKLEELGKGEKMTLLDFENLFTLALESVKVETVPSYIDAVYVGDATRSYFEDVDTLFVLGATANALPQARNDTGIIDDNDIEKLRLNFLLEPQIKVLNRRSRLKLFECLLHAKNKLVVSCPAVEDGRQSSVAGFVEDLRKMFGNNILHTQALEDISLAGLSEEEKLGNLKFFIGCKQNLPSAYAFLKNKGKMPVNFVGAVGGLLEKEIFENAKLSNLSQSTKGVLLKKGKVSASQLETYFTCPFKHFVSYGLKIKENENVEPNRRLFGIFQHALLEKFLKENEDVSKLQQKSIEKFLNENLLETAKQVYDEKILKRKAFLSYLKNESRIILQNIVYEQAFSAFRPKLLEEGIFQDFVEGQKLVGYVDRVDAFESFFRIIDYKTGKTSSIKKELYYGKKLQLFLYARAIEKQSGLVCGGVYYFDCQTKYSKGRAQNRLSGLTLAQDKLAIASDKRLVGDDVKSDIVGFAVKKSAKEGEFSFKGGNPVSSFDELFKYAESVSQKAIGELKEGFVLDKPFKNACESCPYISICCHREEDGFRIMQTVLDENLKG